MKDIILEHIQAEGPIKEKKLWKQIVKVLSLSETGENGESEIYEQKKTQFKDICQNLLTEKDILAVAGEYSINKAKKAIPQTNTKRKSALDSYSATEDVPAGKKAKTDEEPEYQYKDLWKNGEQYWKEGKFDPEYLRTNPDRYIGVLLSVVS
jgi:hypothetical protein